MESWWKKINGVMKDEKDHEFLTKNSHKTDLRFLWAYLYPGVSVIHMHQTMFTNALKLLGSEE